MDTPIRSRRSFPSARLAAAIAAAMLSTSAWAADNRSSPGNPAVAPGAAHCEHHSASTDRTACREEAAAAQQARRQGELTGAQQPLDQNAMSRCSALPAGEQDACRARIAGSGRTSASGSVQGGGILREHREVVEAPAGTPAGAAATGAAAGTGTGTGAAAGSTGAAKPGAAGQGAR